MPEHHLSSEVLEAYVLGMLDDVGIAQAEAHVSACPSCEARLQREASLELAFAAVATRDIVREARAEWRRAVPAVAFGAIAMAAALVFWVTPHRDSDTHSAAYEEAPVETASGDASTATASLETQADGSRIGVRD